VSALIIMILYCLLLARFDSIFVKLISSEDRLGLIGIASCNYSSTSLSSYSCLADNSFATVSASS